MRRELFENKKIKALISSPRMTIRLVTGPWEGLIAPGKEGKGADHQSVRMKLEVKTGWMSRFFKMLASEMKDRSRVN